MAPTKPARTSKDDRVRVIISFAAGLEAQLPTASSSRTAVTLLQEVERHIADFPSKLGAFATSKADEIDSRGTALWNLCTRLRRGHDSREPQDVPVILLMARVFAFFLLDCAYENGRTATKNLTKLMKIGIKASKSCLEHKQFDLARRSLEKVGGYDEVLNKLNVQLEPEDREACERLVAEYYVLRTALAWHQGQLDMAEFMYKKSTSRQIDPHTAESLADVLYEMGKDLLGKQQFELAIKWLERAFDIMDGQELDILSMDASELRQSILQSSVKALLGTKAQENIEKANSLVNMLDNELGDKLVVLLLRLELLSASSAETFDSSEYSDVICRMTRTLNFNDDTFRLIMFHIRKLNDKSPNLACKALDELLSLRILKEERADWTEKILVTRLYMTAGQRESPDSLMELSNLFSLIVDNIAQPISSGASLGAHTLLWKRIESNYTQSQFDLAEQWCRLAMHRVFEKSGELNMARISRKLLLCALERQDIATAREIFGSMSDTARNEPMTRFLMYKIAIRCGESELAAECLQIVSSSTANDSTLLYACVLDAMNVHNKAQTLVALQLVLEKYGYGAVGTIHLPSLLRTTLGLMESSKVVEGSDNAEAMVEKTCKIFEGAVTSMRKSSALPHAAETVWTVLELDWFAKNSYNLAIKNLTNWAPRQTLRVLICCIAFIDQYPSDISEHVSEDLALRKMFCEFTAATALVTLARGEDNIEVQLQDYLDLRKHVESFDSLLQERLDKIEEVSAQDLLQKLSVLATFDFEAACQLKAWDELGEIILKADTCKRMRVYQVMADCLLCSQAPTQVLISTMKKIINEVWGLEEVDGTRLAKYMRCLFQVALSDNPQIAEQLLEQVYQHAEEASETDAPYPTEELDWIATKAFNHAVDLYCSGDDEGSKNWAYKALNIAHFCNDEGALEELLQTKLAGLKFDS